MSYKITITQTQLVKTVTPKEYKQVGVKEVLREEAHYKEEGPKTRIDPVWGYTPQEETLANVTVDVLSQQVETLDLPKVIKAINNL